MRHNSPREIAAGMDLPRLLQDAYKQVFGYRPELGEPDDGWYHVHGFAWRLSSDGMLQVRDVRGAGRLVPNLFVFKTLLERGALYESE